MATQSDRFVTTAGFGSCDIEGFIRAMRAAEPTDDPPASDELGVKRGPYIPRPGARRQGPIPVRDAATDMGRPVTETAAHAERRIQSFDPKGLSEAEQRSVLPEAKQLVARSQPAKESHAKARLTGMCSYLCCLLAHGHDVSDARVVFDVDHINHWLSTLDDLEAGTRANYGRAVLDVYEVIVGKRPAQVLAVQPERDPLAPYVADEVRRFVSAAQDSASPERRHNMSVVLATGFGAGLSTADIRHLRGTHVSAGQHGVVINVPGERARPVTVLRAWENRIADAALRAGDDYLFRPGRVDSKNFMNRYLPKWFGRSPTVNMQRMRATWVVWHLTSRTPIRALIAAAGVSEIDGDGIARYLRFVPNMTHGQAHCYLREAPGQLQAWP